VAAGPPDHYLVIDGHKRVAALEQLGRDTVEATMKEEALSKIKPRDVKAGRYRPGDELLAFLKCVFRAMPISVPR
jgi:hypothetical protein